MIDGEPKRGVFWVQTNWSICSSCLRPKFSEQFWHIYSLPWSLMCFWPFSNSIDFVRCRIMPKKVGEKNWLNRICKPCSLFSISLFLHKCGKKKMFSIDFLFILNDVAAYFKKYLLTCTWSQNVGNAFIYFIFIILGGITESHFQIRIS